MPASTFINVWTGIGGVSTQLPLEEVSSVCSCHGNVGRRLRWYAFFLPSPILAAVVDVSEGLVHALGSTLVSLGRFAEASRMLLHFKKRPSIELSGGDGVDREPFKLLLRCGEWEEARLVVRCRAFVGYSHSANEK